MARLVEKYLLIWLVLLGLIAYLWPRFGFTYDPFVASSDYLPWLIVVTMFFVGWLLPKDEVRVVAASWPKVFGGTCVQYLSMPLLALFWAKVFGLTGPWFWGAILVGCVPGAMASNVLTLAARGNVSYSLSLTTLATVVSPIFVPLVLGLLLDKQTSAAEFGGTSIKLAWMVVLPVVCGHLLTLAAPSWQWLGKRIGPTVANLTILWIIVVVVAKNRAQIWPDTNDSQTPIKLILALLAINLSGYVAGWCGSRLLGLDLSMRKALTLEVGLQNAGLGTVLAMNTLFPDDPSAAIPTAMYTFGCVVTGTMLASYWSNIEEDEALDTQAAS